MYIFRDGTVLDVSYKNEIRVDEYRLQEGEHWVSSKDEPTHHFIINANGEITKGLGGWRPTNQIDKDGYIISGKNKGCWTPLNRKSNFPNAKCDKENGVEYKRPKDIVLPKPNPQKDVDGYMAKQEEEFRLNWENTTKAIQQKISADSGVDVDYDFANNVRWAIGDFTQVSFGRMRKIQRGEDLGDKVTEKEKQKYKDQVNLLEDFIQMTGKYKREAYRGIASDDVLHYKVGDIINMGGVSSWSKDEKIAKNVAKYRSKQGMYGATKGAKKVVYICPQMENSVDISPYSTNKDEDEILASGYCNYKIENIEKDKGIYYVHLQAIKL